MDIKDMMDGLEIPPNLPEVFKSQASNITNHKLPVPVREIPEYVIKYAMVCSLYWGLAADEYCFNSVDDIMCSKAELQLEKWFGLAEYVAQNYKLD